MSETTPDIGDKESSDNIHNEGMSREDAYRLGVREVSPVPVIFVDPDRIRLRAPGPPSKRHVSSSTAAGRSLSRQVEGQVEGSIDVLRDKVNEDDDMSLGQIAKEIRKSGPAALAYLEINGRDYGLAIIPKHSFDSKREIIYGFTDHLDRNVRKEIFENMPGSNHDWMRLVGNHEGAHLTMDASYDTNLDTLMEEVRADRIAMEMLEARGQGDIALAFRDLRALSGRVDPKHSSAPFLNSNDSVTEMHFNVAWNFREKTDKAVETRFDWATYEGDASTPEELLAENPEAYFAVAQDALDELQADAMEKYNADPAVFDNQEAVVDA